MGVASIVTCDSVADIVREVFDLVRWDRDRLRPDGHEVFYYFRGERKAFPDESTFLTRPQCPGVYYTDKRLEHESDIFNEALRTFPEEFSKDRTTFEKLTRMEHYCYPTRLMNVTPKLITALGMVKSEGYDPKPEDSVMNGYVHVYRVRGDRIKYGTSDTVTALSNLARIKKERVTISDLSYLVAECKNDRAGFFWDENSETSHALQRDIQKVWCVRPMVNNIRMNFQVGEFFLFGCGEQKTPINTTFDECNYDDEDSPSYGIARIGIIAVTPMAKKELQEFEQTLDIGDERLYPDFEHHSKMLRNKYKKG